MIRPHTGHVHRVRAVAVELGARGHEVAWLAPREEMRSLLPAGARLIDLSLAPGAGPRPAGDVDSKLQHMLEHGVGFLPSAEAALDEFHPDVVALDRMITMADPLILAGTLAARRRGLPWATMTTGGTAAIWAAFESTDKTRTREEALGKIQRAADLDPLDWPLVSPDLVLVFSTLALMGEQLVFPPQYQLVGPALEERVEETPFPWERLAERPRVLVSLGTVYRERGHALYPALVEGLGGSDLQVIVSAPPELVPEAPANVLVQEWVPQLALLPHMDAVVCHGGHNTTSEALAHGLPLVILPMIDDQISTARQIIMAGAGVRILFRMLDASTLRNAVTAVLTEPHYRENAERIKASFELAGGTRAAADALEQLAR